MTQKTVFITGGLGYIGLPTAHALYKKGYRVIVFDLGVPKNQYPFLVIQGDIRHREALTKTMALYTPDIVIHLAALKSVSGSEKEKKEYFETNVSGTNNVLWAMQNAGCQSLLFASSAAVYDAGDGPVKESSLLHPLSYYGQTKKAAEALIRKKQTIHSVILRYFNVVGDEPVMHNPKLIPSALRVAQGLQKNLILYGCDYPTPDGTAIRDYVHVDDVVRVNCMAILYLEKKTPSFVANIASGIGVSNLEVVKEVEREFHVRIPIIYRKKRKETVVSIADIAKAKKILHWVPTSTVSSIIKSFSYSPHSVHS